jgi:F-type H+-transporting ATPase subunit a
MVLSPDEIIYWQWHSIVINATLVYTWIAMLLLVGGSWLITRHLSSGQIVSTKQTVLETIVLMIEQQIEEIMRRKADRYLPFVGTLFLFIATLNLLNIIPGFRSPTGSLSTTAALAACVFFAVPVFGMRARGVRGYLRQYVQPTVFMLPFNIIHFAGDSPALFPCDNADDGIARRSDSGLYICRSGSRLYRIGHQQ